MRIEPTRRAFVLGASTFATLAATRVAATPSDRKHAQAATEVAKALYAGQPSPALSLAVARSDGPVWSQVFGKANLEFDVAATPAHSFRLGSVSKILTSTTAAKLVTRRQLDLDAPIATWLPDLPPAHRATTMRMLLTHRGGVRHYIPRDLDPMAPGGAIYQRHFATRDEILGVFINDPLVAPPGTKVSYTTFGFTLASLVMEAAAGKPFPQLILAEIGEGFGLASLALDEPLAILPNRASGYSTEQDVRMFMPASAGFWKEHPGTRWTNIPAIDPSYAWAGAGFLMTPTDLARLGAALLDSSNARITADERRLLFTRQTEKAGNVPPLGLGWQITLDAKGRQRWHHAGSTPGGRASLVIYPDLGLSIAFASNVMLAPGDVFRPSSDLADAFGV